MSKAETDMACPVCGTELSLAQLFSHEDTQRTFARLAAVSVPMGARVTQYITLFAPVKSRLTLPKQMRLILQLLPDLERQAITHRGRDWHVPLEAWALGIDQMVAARDAGRLDLPMKGHAYLYAVLAGFADKVEGKAENQREAARRAPPAHAHETARARVGTTAERDPELTKIAADAQKRAPMPPEVRAQLAALRAPLKDGPA